MNPAFKILFQSLVKQFYKENAAAFVLVFTMMFCIISKVDGAGFYQYHYRLATGMLQSNGFLLLVFFVWFLYVRKFVTFVSAIIASPHYSFLQVYNSLSRSHRNRLFFSIEVLLLMPVLLYAIVIAFVGIHQQLYSPVLITISYLLLLCIAATAWHVHQLDYLNKRWALPVQQLSEKLRLSSYYLFALIRFVAREQINIWAGIKIVTCGVLYLVFKNNSVNDDDISLAFLFYNFGVLTNGVLIFRIRLFEETYLNFYKTLPVSAAKRFLQYAMLYLILFIPELITILLLTPVHLHVNDAINFALCGYNMLLLMNSFTFLQQFRMKDFISLLLAIFFVQCIFMVTLGFIASYFFFFVLAVLVFFKRYYKAEQLQYT